MAKRVVKGETSGKRAESEDERRTRWALEGVPVLTAEYTDCEEFDPNSEQPEGTCILGLEPGANVRIEQLARQIRRCCSDKKWNRFQKRVACEQIVNLAFLSTESMNCLAIEFPEPFREIAEELSHFPCLFPASAEGLRALQKVMWDKFNLGKRHTLKLRAAPGRKTFSEKTWVNRFLIRHIALVHESARNEEELDPGWKYGVDTFREVACYVPLTAQNARQWLDVIWKLLLMGIPEPEKHPRLRQLVARPSLNNKRTRRDGTVGQKTQAHNVRASIKAKLGVYLKRMLNDSAVHK